jgi:hypothetical protein
MSNFDDCIRARMDYIDRYNQFELSTYLELLNYCTAEWAHQLVHMPEFSVIWETQVVAPVSMAHILLNNYGDVNPAHCEDDAIKHMEAQFPYNQEG